MRLGLKVLLVLGMTLAILVPLTMIRGVIHDRQLHRQEAVASVTRSYAGAQAFSGPVLVVPYTQTVEVEETGPQGVVVKRLRQQPGQWTFFPTRLDVEGRLQPGTRQLGLHQVRVYEWHARAAAGFDVRLPPPSGPLPRSVGRPWLRYGIADVRGLVGAPSLVVDGKAVALGEGTGGGSDAGGGVHARLPAPAPDLPLRLQTRLDFVLAGTESLALMPLARDNRFVLASDWPHPRFGGSFLPRSRDVTASGFRAQWEVSSLATRAQAQYLAGQVLPQTGGTSGVADGADASQGPDTVAVSLVDPVNVYSQADRASKYGLLFVLLSFVGFFIFELIKQLRIHPIQYALVGLALAIFFLLLVSLSEHMAFGLAYLVASVACIGLLAVYLGAVLHSLWRGLAFAAMLATLYAALYGLLVSEDNALVLGSGLLFVILAAIMLVTRRVDWYRLAGHRPGPPAM